MERQRYRWRNEFAMQWGKESRLSNACRQTIPNPKNVSYIFQAIMGDIVLTVKDPRNCNLHFWGWCAGFKEVRKSLEGKNVILQFQPALLLLAVLP